MHSAPSPRTVHFGHFDFDVGAGELRKGGTKVRLQQQPLQVLQILLEHAGNVISRDELQKRIWPSDTFVDFDHGINNAITRLREGLGDTAETPRFIETIPRRGYRFIGSVGSSPARRIESLAVLPLENLSQDPEQEYFADGLTEALITNLAKINALQLVSRTSAMHYKGVHRPLREIARELQVDGVVEGTVMRSGPRVRISAQLINAHTDAHVWAESYDRDLRDVLELQSEVARAIAREVQVKVTPQEQAQLAQTRPVDPEAYEAYLKGRYYWNKRTSDSFKKGVEYLQRAVEKDPTYAAAYAGLADSAGVSGFYGFASPEEGCGKAKAAARNALEIEEMAEAHASLGWAIMHYDWDLSTAQREFQLAIALNPRYATAHQWYGHCLGYMGRFNEAFVELKCAIQLEPLSLIIATSYAGISWLGREWEQAIEHSLRTLDLDPNFPPARWILGEAYVGKGDHEAAIPHLQTLVKASGSAVIYLTRLGHAYATAGRHAEARRVLRQLREFSKSGYVMPCWMAHIFTALNDIDEAFRWLDKAYAERSAWMALLKMDPWFDPLRSDPRFQDLLQRVTTPIPGV
jgi:TolB-like protein/Flp pilus assembly protein TadD